MSHRCSSAAAWCPRRAASGTTTASYDLNISLELEQTPVSPGMAKLLNMLDVAISESKKLP